MGRLRTTKATGPKTVPQVKYLGIDFGSSNTSVVARVVKGKESCYVTFFDNGTYSSFATAMGERQEDGKYFFFSDACNGINNGALKPVEDLKERFSGEGIGDGRRFLEAVIAAVKNAETAEGERFDFSALESIGFGVPAYFDEREQNAYSENMRNVLSAAFDIDPKKIVCRAEPELAAVAYNASGKGGRRCVPHAGDGLLVLDFGGYTLDIAAMEFVEDASRRKLLLNSCSCGSYCTMNNLPMGKGITMEICEEVYGEEARFDYKIDEAKCALFCGDRYDRIEVGEAPNRIRLRNGKYLQMRYRYGSGVQAEDNVVRVGMTPGDGQSECPTLYLENEFDDWVGLIFDYLWNCKVRADKGFRYILFTGGGSGMKPLRDKVLERMQARYSNDPVGLWMDEAAAASGELMLQTTAEMTEQRTVCVSSANAVALGGCLIASGEREFIVSARTPRPGPYDDGMLQALRAENEACLRVYNMALQMLIDLGQRDKARELKTAYREYFLRQRR